MMNLKDLYIIFGPAGSGKTQQAIWLSRQLKLDVISWGKIFRSHFFDIKYKSQSRIIKNTSSSIIERSRAVAQIIGKEMDWFYKTKAEGMILEGFPRRIEEAKLLLAICRKHNCHLKALIRINPSFETCSKRLKKMNLPLADIQKDFFEYMNEFGPAFGYLKQFSEKHFDISGDDEDIVIFSNILIKLLRKNNGGGKIFSRISASTLPTTYGLFRILTYQSRIDYNYHLALVKGRVNNCSGVLTRVHSSCVTGDVFRSLKCDCGEQLHEAMKRISESEKGAIIYLFQEGRGINIINKIKAYSLQKKGLDTVQANEKLDFPVDLRHYEAVKDILTDLKIKSIRLLTNNPEKVRELTEMGIIVEEIVPLEILPNRESKKYLLTKRDKMGHKLSFIK